MRLRALGLGALAAAAALHACAEYTNDDPVAANDAGPDSGTGVNDAAPDVFSEAGVKPGPLDEAGDAGNFECFDFHNGLAGFDPVGTVTPGADGARIDLRGEDSPPSALRRTFHRAGGIATSRLQLDLSLTDFTGFGENGYADSLTLYYGLPAEFESTALSAFVVTDNGVEVNVRYAKGAAFAGSFPLASTQGYSKLNGLVAIDSTWAPEGRHAMTLDGMSRSVAAKTAASGAEDLTVEIGGKLFSSTTPQATIVVRKVCVELN